MVIRELSWQQLSNKTSVNTKFLDLEKEHRRSDERHTITKKQVYSGYNCEM